MKEYIAVKKFHLGEITKDIMKDERIKFDGTNAIIRGEKVRAPSLMRCVGTLIQEALTDADGKQLEQTAPSANFETPQQRSARLKQERLNQLRGSAGSGQFLEDHEMKMKESVTPRKTSVEAPLKDQGAKVVPSHNVEVKTNAEARATKAADTAEKSKKKTHSKEVLVENDGKVVSKLKTAAIVEDEQPQSFYEALLEGETKKLDIAKDQFVATKRPVVHLDSQDEAVEVKRLVSADEITPSKDPLKEWSSMTATKKENFLKKATDTAVIKKIIERESGGVKRKAEERLANLDGGKGLG